MHIDRASPRAKRLFAILAIAVALVADLSWLVWFWRHDWELETFGELPSGTPR
jgi:hypothetical protein